MFISPLNRLSPLQYSLPSGGSSPVISDLELYMNAVGILNDSTLYYDGAEERTGAQLWTYVGTLIDSLKSNNLWNNRIAIYPLQGTTAAAQKFNLKSPYDLDTSFRLTFDEGTSPCTHDKFGFNCGVNKLANTKLIGVADGLTSVTGGSAFWYSRTSIANSGYLWGSYDKFMYYQDTSTYYLGMGAAIGGGSGFATTLPARYIANRAPSSSYERILKNNVLVNENSKTFVNFGGTEVTIGAVTDGVTKYYSSAVNISLYDIGYGLTTGEESILDGIYSTFLTSLGRL